MSYVGGTDRAARVRAGRRGIAELLVERAAWLPPADKALVEAVHREGLSVTAYTRRCGESGSDPVPDARLACGGPDDEGWVEAASRVARRRLRNLERRLLSDRFAFVIARRATWVGARRRVAVVCVLQGRSIRAASEELGISLHTVRRHLHTIGAMFDEHLESMRQVRGMTRSGGGAAARSGLGGRPASGRDGASRWMR